MASQIAVAALIAGILLGLSLFYGWRQKQSLGRARDDADLSDDDRNYLRHQARLRLAGCTLMLAMAAMLVANFALGLEQRAEEIGNQVPIRKAQGQVDAQGKVIYTAEEKHFLLLYEFFWITFLLTLLGIVVLAGLDLLATHRYRRRYLQQIAADRRAMLEEQVGRLRSERNGHGGGGVVSG